MIAAISPADINYEETLSTLRYADRAKQIMCKAVINEDANAKIIRELKEEIAKLRSLLVAEGIELEQNVASNAKDERSHKKSGGSVSLIGENAIEQLQENEKLMSQLNETWEEKLKKTEQIRLQREAVLSEIGVATREDGDAVGVFLTPHSTPHLVNLNEDPLMSECLIYYIKEGVTRVGRSDATVPQDIQLQGSNILSQHCIFQNRDGQVKLIPLNNSNCYVNGIKIDPDSSEVLRTGSRVILGKYHVFRFQDFKEARDNINNVHKSGQTRRDNLNEGSTEDSSLILPVDWSFAQLELLEKQGIDLKLEMEQKLQALEEQYKKEKEEADQVFQEQRKKYEARIESLERQVNEQSMTLSTFGASITPCNITPDDTLQDFSLPLDLTDHQENILRKAVRRWKVHQFTSLRDDLWGNAIFLKEANAISVELKKRVSFQFILLTDSVYSPLSREAIKNYSDGSLEQDTDYLPRTVVAVEVLDAKNSANHIWSLKKLR